MGVELEKGYYIHGTISKNKREKYNYKPIKVYPDKVSYMKDLILCEEVNYGYRECFHRMDLGGITNEKNTEGESN